jgi:pyruvate formate lyase activating enzyme
MGQWGLDAHGKCAKCGTALPGVFEAKPGNWGARRLPVRMVAYAD